MDNIEQKSAVGAISYLNDLIAQLELTPEEKEHLSFICPLFQKCDSFGNPKPIPFRRLTNEGKEYILANYKEKTLAEMAYELDLGSNSIRTFLVSSGITNYKRFECIKKLTDKEKKYIMSHYQKMTINEMAEKLNRKYHTIANFMNHKGLQRKRQRA